MTTVARFVYRKVDGECSTRELSTVKETGYYLQGFDLTAGHVCTFRKDRIVQYFDGLDALLSDPFPGPPPRVERSVPRDQRPQVLFTGFAAVQRAHLERQAEDGGLHVVKTVTQHLTFLCCGGNAGPAKVEKARQQRVYIMNQAELLALLETGELPDHAVDELDC